MCVGAAKIAQRHDVAGRLRIGDVATGVDGLSAEALQTELHVVDEHGSVSRGYDAIVAILISAPRRRWLRPLIGSRPARWIGGRLYAAVARNRRRAV